MVVLLEIALVAAVAFGVLGYALRGVGGMTIVEPDAGDDGLPPGRISPQSVDHARFGLAFRGYRMSEVDRVLDRLRDELSARDAELMHLRGDWPPPDSDVLGTDPHLEHEPDQESDQEPDPGLEPAVAVDQPGPAGAPERGPDHSDVAVSDLD